MSIDDFTYRSIATAATTPDREIDFEKGPGQKPNLASYTVLFDSLFRVLGQSIQAMEPADRIKATGLLRRFAGAAMGPVSYDRELDDIRLELMHFLFGPKS